MIDALRTMIARWREQRPARSRLNRRPSALLARALPWLAVVVGSLLPGLVWIASAPVAPPLGLLALLAWLQLRPALLPVWAGLPLGLFDDLVSGQPLGCAALLWSAATLALDQIEARVPWRGFLVDWLIAAALIAAVIGLGAVLANLARPDAALSLVAPQVALAILVYPLVGRAVAALDRLRLAPFVRIAPWR